MGKGGSADNSSKDNNRSYNGIEVLDVFVEKHLASNQTNLLFGILQMLGRKLLKGSILIY